MKENILSIIDELDNLPADHEPDVEHLWDAIRRIQNLLTLN
tara:strand:+ start:174 stop:296 length:123 start_codon:yes stop_codon:yes gene_type:complete